MTVYSFKSRAISQRKAEYVSTGFFARPTVAVSCDQGLCSPCCTCGVNWSWSLCSWFGTASICKMHCACGSATVCVLPSETISNSQCECGPPRLSATGSPRRRCKRRGFGLVFSEVRICRNSGGRPTIRPARRPFSSSIVLVSAGSVCSMAVFHKSSLMYWSPMVVSSTATSITTTSEPAGPPSEWKILLVDGPGGDWLSQGSQQPEMISSRRQKTDRRMAGLPVFPLAAISIYANGNFQRLGHGLEHVHANDALSCRRVILFHLNPNGCRGPGAFGEPTRQSGVVAFGFADLDRLTIYVANQHREARSLSGRELDLFRRNKVAPLAAQRAGNRDGDFAVIGIIAEDLHGFVERAVGSVGELHAELARPAGGRVLPRFAPFGEQAR